MSCSFESRNLRGCTKLSSKTKKSIQYALSYYLIMPRNTYFEKYFEIGAVKVQNKMLFLQTMQDNFRHSEAIKE